MRTADDSYCAWVPEVPLWSGSGGLLFREPGLLGACNVPGAVGVPGPVGLLGVPEFEGLGTGEAASGLVD